MIKGWKKMGAWIQNEFLIVRDQREFVALEMVLNWSQFAGMQLTRNLI